MGTVAARAAPASSCRSGSGGGGERECFNEGGKAWWRCGRWRPWPAAAGGPAADFGAYVCMLCVCDRAAV